MSLLSVALDAARAAGKLQRENFGTAPVVNEMLRKDTRVREFHMGAWNEGGAGVTIAVFA